MFYQVDREKEISSLQQKKRMKQFTQRPLDKTWRESPEPIPVGSAVLDV